MTELEKQIAATMQSDAMRKWLADTADARRRACAGELRQVRRAEKQRARAEAFWSRRSK